MRILFTNDRCINVDELFFKSHRLDGYGNSVRNLITKAPERLFPYQFRCDLSDRLVRNGVLIVEGLSLGHISEYLLNENVHVVAGLCRYRHDLGKIAYVPVSINDAEKFILFYRIDLIDHKYDRDFYPGKALRYRPVLRSDESGCFHEPKDEIHL